jgi:hypothetical protein
VRRSDTRFGENEDDDLGIVDCPNNLVGVKGSGHDIPGSDPAPQTGTLERSDQRVSYGGILRGVADEYCGRAAGRLILATAFDHLRPPD